jgi:hypothetical protein
VVTPRLQELYKELCDSEAEAGRRPVKQYFDD